MRKINILPTTLRKTGKDRWLEWSEVGTGQGRSFDGQDSEGLKEGTKLS